MENLHPHKPSEQERLRTERVESTRIEEQLFFKSLAETPDPTLRAVIDERAEALGSTPEEVVRNAYAELDPGERLHLKLEHAKLFGDYADPSIIAKEVARRLFSPHTH